MAFADRGYSVDLTRVPDDILDLFIEWHNDGVAREKEEMEKLR